MDSVWKKTDINNSNKSNKSNNMITNNLEDNEDNDDSNDSNSNIDNDDNDDNNDNNDNNDNDDNNYSKHNNYNKHDKRKEEEEEKCRNDKQNELYAKMQIKLMQHDEQFYDKFSEDIHNMYEHITEYCENRGGHIFDKASLFIFSEFVKGTTKSHINRANKIMQKYDV
jgi:flagellum-specific peptidoglycan hydrolase FlgJ